MKFDVEYLVFLQNIWGRPSTGDCQQGPCFLTTIPTAVDLWHQIITAGGRFLLSFKYKYKYKKNKKNKKRKKEERCWRIRMCIINNIKK